jgi:hypothetical protein
MKSLTRISAALILAIATTAPWAGGQTPAPAPIEKTITLSGQLGVQGVVLRGLPGDPMSDEKGTYKAELPQGWSGTITPVKVGYVFEPPSRKYSNMRSDQTSEDYMASVITYVISGNAGMPDVSMRGLPDDPVSEPNGAYRSSVSYGWAGVVAPEKPGYAFLPERRSYNPVTSDRTRQNYAVRRERMPGPVVAQDVLIVPTAGVNAAAFAETAEDMRVMLQILREKTIESRTGTGRPLLSDYGPIFGQGGRGTEALYIQGFGAMFVMEVDFPLVSEPKPGAAEKPGQPQESDPVWQRAREKLTASGQTAAPEPGSSFNIDQFKDNLVRALRHATNIRHLDPNERVILTVTRSAGQVHMPRGISYGADPYGGGGLTMNSGGYGYGGGSFNADGANGYTESNDYSTISTPLTGRLTRAGTTSSTTQVGGNVLTIQAKKADIDAFAKDQISYEQFRQRVKTFSY